MKQQLAAVRMLFDWLITGQVAPSNPASAVRGPTHVVKTGKTPVLEGKEWRRLIDAIPTDTARDLRDRALIATLTYGFARIGAALKMRVEDLQSKGSGWLIRLHEKGGKQHLMLCHHALAEALHAYIAAAPPNAVSIATSQSLSSAGPGINALPTENTAKSSAPKNITETSTTVSGGGTFAAGSPQTVAATPISGHTFVHWTENGRVVSTSESYTFTLSGNVTLVADFR